MLDAILEAMDRIVRTSGLEGLRIAEVARIAGVGKASIYDYFATREALVAAWEERAMNAQLPRFTALLSDLATTPPTFERSISAIVDMVMAMFSDHARAYGVGVSVEPMARSSVRRELAERIVAIVATALMNAPDFARLRVERLDVAARIIVHTVLNTSHALANTELSVDDLRLHRRDLTEMLALYLLKDPKVGDQDGIAST